MKDVNVIERSSSCSLTLEAEEIDIFECLADEKSLKIFKTICNQRPIALSGMKLKRRQYYSGLTRMTSLNLVEKLDGKYRATSLGKILKKFLDYLEIALTEDHWKHTAIDALETEADLLLPPEEYSRILSSLRVNNNLPNRYIV